MTLLLSMQILKQTLFSTEQPSVHKMSSSILLVPEANVFITNMCFSGSFVFSNHSFYPVVVNQTFISH